MKKRMIFLFILSAGAALFADYSSSFLDLSHTTLGEGTRGAVVTLSGDYGPGFFYNPANSSSMKETKLIIDYEHKFLFSNNSHCNSASLILPSVRSMRFGVGFISQLISGIPIYPEYSDTVSFEPEGYFSDNAVCVLLNGSYIYADAPLNRFTLSAGANVKPIYHSIYENRGIGAGLDAGVNASYFLPASPLVEDNKISAGVSLTDAGGTRVKWDTDSLTTDIRGMQTMAALSWSASFSKIKSDLFVETGWRSRDGGIISASVIYGYNRTAGLYGGFTQLLNSEEGVQERTYGGGCFIEVLNFGIYYSLSAGELGLSHSVGAKYRL